ELDPASGVDGLAIPVFAQHSSELQMFVHVATEDAPAGTQAVAIPQAVQGLCPDSAVHETAARTAPPREALLVVSRLPNDRRFVWAVALIPGVLALAAFVSLILGHGAHRARQAEPSDTNSSTKSDHAGFTRELLITAALAILPLRLVLVPATFDSPT